MRVATRLAVVWLGLCAPLAAPAGANALAASRTAVRPVVVELFTAQGCASCPQANQMLGELAQRRGVIALTYPVDYWDYLGWRDTFAMPEFTSRQRAYVARLRLKEIYTPELVVSGRREAPAVDLDRVSAVIATDAAQRQRGPAIGFGRGGALVTVGSGTTVRGGAELWLVRYDPMRREVRVRSGENAGKTVTHVNVVRELVRLGAWNGRARTYSAPEESTPGLETLVLLQGLKGGPILAAARD
ncbi:MAG TPA: DUF1223 domain-containing protein [Caulobacteraceae bacterium]|nr:DUF1223 domain-containing protein [Caulobacteraceae bacterium]